MVQILLELKLAELELKEHVLLIQWTGSGAAVSQLKELQLIEFEPYNPSTLLTRTLSM